ncbi:Cupin domain-containing protein [Sphingomonas guangdongensis]|uniref:Cupin domain-containing protein n=1 Tax=Sphingomonas guangdongensis TaxID=1141890 RepID=A0A285QZQ8_9SPHN|nr:cupin domain-containing protein [Sphingomonas guangdongensis]SOB87341.1 Cupin domain-containing protein [Sphingomonas guangdongensis]
MTAEVVDLQALIAIHGAVRYHNRPVAAVNDHVVRVSVMTEPYFWHRHPNSDETFLVIEGEVELALEDRTLLLREGQVATVPAGAAHCSRPLTARSVNLTIERADLVTERVAR